LIKICKLILYWNRRYTLCISK